ncbi:TNF receptor-associated factor 6-like [Lineus longissimus]|uniref:TNF receptor-associated factor 6-like n=1 Tax=Lineus longissimus TaxID=88925 RepID=UPI00315C5469
MASANAPRDHSMPASNTEPEIDKKYICPVCLSVLKEPVQTKCGHRFCRHCFKTSAGDRFRTKCPVDNTWLSTNKDVFEDAAFKRELLSVNVACPHKNDGCTWSDEYRGLSSHIRSCEYVTETCPLGCERSCSRLTMQQHVQACPNRLEACKLCDDDIKVGDSLKHMILACPKFPVTCSYCSRPDVVRELLGDHVDPVLGDCPNVNVHCQYYTKGCEFSDCRKDMQKHYDENINQHLRLVCDKLSDTESKLYYQDGEIDILKQRLTEVQADCATQRDQIRTLEAAASPTAENGGNLFWRISLPEGDAFRSQSFNVGANNSGYKFALAINLSDLESDQSGTFSTIAVILQKGEHDDQLPFPFTGLCTVTVLDLSDDEQVPYVKNFILELPRAHSENFVECLQNNARKYKLIKLDHLLENYSHDSSVVLRVDIQPMTDGL